jgi:hypothetical protein
VQVRVPTQLGWGIAHFFVQHLRQPLIISCGLRGIAYESSRASQKFSPTSRCILVPIIVGPCVGRIHSQAVSGTRESVWNSKTMRLVGLSVVFGMLFTVCTIMAPRHLYPTDDPLAGQTPVPIYRITMNEPRLGTFPVSEASRKTIRAISSS